MQTYEQIIGAIIVAILILTPIILLSNQSSPKDIKTNYLGLAQLGVIPNIQAPNQIGANDIDTGVRATRGNESYALIKDSFNRIYAWRIK